MITKTAWFDISRDDEDTDLRVLMAMNGLRSGDKVILYVGNRPFVSHRIYNFRTYTPTLHIELVGSPGATEMWEDALLERGHWGAA